MLKASSAILLVFALGCESKPGTATPSTSTSASAPAASAATPPLPGPLTLDGLMAAKDTVKVGDDWKTAIAALVAKLGPETTKGPDRLVWGIPAADQCSYLMIRESSDKVSELSPATTHSRAKSLEFEDCYLFLDRTPPDKDPAAPGPEADRIYAVGELLDGIDAARSKWLGKKVRVRGLVMSSVRSGATPAATMASLSVADEKDASKRVGVQIRHDVKAAPQDGKQIVVTAEGVIASMGRSLDDARIVK
jgi:hypothetical protein